MILLLLIRLARLIFYSRTLWNAFKVLKVTKSRRKIRPPLLNRQDQKNPSHRIQTPPSSNPLTSAQRIRRTRIREITQLCLLWVIWNHFKPFLDGISWLIPFYDEFNLVFLICLILIGPSAADTLFTHSIHRIITPYERSFDSILGTTHDVLQISIYLVTCGPKLLSLKWKKWKARQLTQSLLLAPTTAPPIRLNAPLSAHPQPQKSKPEHFSAPTSAPPVSFNAVPTRAGSSKYLVVPERRPIPSRKLSDGYRRSVSSNRLKGFACDTTLYNTRSASTHRTVYPFRPQARSVHLTTNLNDSEIIQTSKCSQLPLSKLSSKENMHQFNFHLNESQGKQEESHSIIIHEDSMFIHQAAINPTSSIYHPPVRIARQKRIRDMNDDDSLAFRKAKKALRASSVQIVANLNIAQTRKPPSQASKVTPAPKPLLIHQDGQPSLNSPSDPCMLSRSAHFKDVQGPSLSPPPASSTVGVMADALFSHSTPEAPIVSRRPHHSDDPLSSPDSHFHQLEPLTLQDCLPHEHEAIREKALSSVRSLISSTDLSPHRLNIQHDRHASKNVSSKPLPLPSLSNTQDLQLSFSSPQRSSSAIDLSSDLALSHGKAKASTVPRRLHHPDEPLPLPDSQFDRHESFSLLDSLPREHEEIREKALNSVRSLISTTELPCSSRSTGWLSQRLPSTMTDDISNISSTSSQFKKSNRKSLPRTSSIDNSRRKKKKNIIIHQSIDYDNHLRRKQKKNRAPIHRSR